MHAGKRARQSDTFQPSDRPGEWKEEEEEGKTNTNWINSCQSAGEATDEEQGEEEGGREGGEDARKRRKRRKRDDPTSAGSSCLDRKTRADTCRLLLPLRAVG